MQQAGADHQQPMKWYVFPNHNSVMDCARCYAEYFERFVQFLNRNAYIQIAITGKSFCPAAKDAFWLIFTNPGRFTIIEGIGHIFIDIGKYFVAIMTTITAYMVVTRKSMLFEGTYSTEPLGKLYTPLLPALIVFIVSSMVGHVFMVVYGMGIDTIL
jgi:hypothetical protein